MAIIKSLSLIGLIIAFFFGQLFRLRVFGITFPGIDIFILLFALVNLSEHFFILHTKPKNWYFLYFIVFAFFSLLFNHFVFHYPFIKPLFYFLRLSALFSFFIYPPKIEPLFKDLLLISIVANIIFGFIQYFLWPDFTYFGALGWDPHLFRLVSTYFDPTFTGLIYLLFFCFLFIHPDASARFRWPLMILSYLALAFTYSRSSFLAFVIVAFFYSFKKKQYYYFIGSLILIGLTIFLLPRHAGEGSKLERTSSISAKIVNYQQGFQTFLTSPIIGHGYDNLPYVRPDVKLDSHAVSGFDGSLLNILVTTGIIGFVFFILGFKQLFSQSKFPFQSYLLIIFVHSLFANSLLYPWTLIFLVFMLS